MGKKHEKKAQSLRDMAFETTPAQRLMRNEMEAGMHKRKVIVPGSTKEELEAEVYNAEKLREPVKASAVLDDLLGPVSEDRAVTEMALEIINEQAEGLVLNWQQWPIVQRLVEAGIRRGAGQ